MKMKSRNIVHTQYVNFVMQNSSFFVMNASSELAGKVIECIKGLCLGLKPAGLHLKTLFGL